MKKLLLTIFIAAISTCFSYGQLRIDTKKELNYSHQSIIDFIKDNNFEYALISWGTSTWMYSERNFYCLFIQHGKYYLANISTSVIPQPKLLDQGIIVKQKLLTKIETDSVMKLIKPDSAFRYNQTDLDKLPRSCSYVKDGKTMGLYAIHDAATSFLMEYSNSKTRLLSYYAASEYLGACYPYVKEFGILKGLVNAADQLYGATKNLK
ncbi:MAG: hypothetical protein ABIN91_06950 [Mucilaginibacter sp.]|uniref:hypothetical protein n=1 Tax=Mucilaginibacter sp. TaxID=1882438 RepID=UPI003262DD5F